MSDRERERSGPQPAPEEMAGEAEPRDDVARSDEASREIAELKDRLLRAMAEQENARRRAERERETAVRYAASDFARDLLPIVDSLQRALHFVPEESPIGDDRTVRALVSGIAATERALFDAIERHGMRPIAPAPGEPFDPHVHQAMFEVDDPEHPAGTIAQLVQPGYAHHDRLLRPALVGVAAERGGSAGDEV